VIWSKGDMTGRVKAGDKVVLKSVPGLMRLWGAPGDVGEVSYVDPTDGLTRVLTNGGRDCVWVHKDELELVQ
jgi:hypothetical protein